ncbi:MAG: ABC transporter substrate-binding protein [Oscillospiraceae bacterium]
MKISTKKIISAILAIVLVASCFAACGSPANNGGDKLVIGAIGPLTGGASTYGNSVKKGAELAIDEINAAGGINGIKFELKFEDDEAKGDKTKPAYEKLMDQKMNVLLGAVTSDSTLALSDLVKKDGILQLTPSASVAGATENPTAFRLCFTDPVQGTELAKYAFNTLKYTKVAALYDQDDTYATGVFKAFKATFEGLGGSVVVDAPYAQGTQDFNAQLTKVKGANADAIFMPIYTQDIARIAIAANEKGINLPMFGSDGWDGILKTLQPAEYKYIENALYLTPFVASDESEKVQKFVKAYSAKNNNEVPDQFAADGYDCVYIFAEALKKANVKSMTEFTNEKMVAAMIGLSYDGVTGKVTFDASGEPNKGVKFAKIVDGKYVAVNA